MYINNKASNVQGSTATKHNTHTLRASPPPFHGNYFKSNQRRDPTHLQLAPPLSPSFLQQHGRHVGRVGAERNGRSSVATLQDGEGSNDSPAVHWLYIFAHMAVTPLCDGSARLPIGSDESMVIR
jgi:hypothetical protein